MKTRVKLFTALSLDSVDEQINEFISEKSRDIESITHTISHGKFMDTHYIWVIYLEAE